jgi:mono/diheme cytochrome c family protein
VIKRALFLFPFAFSLFPFLGALDAHDRITTRVTWDREIAPIFEARCVDCHRVGGRSTIALATYQQVRPWAVAIKEEVLTRRMPKWNAARGFGAFANDPSLAPFEIALIAAWVDGGAPENEKKKVTAAPATPAIKPSVFTPPLDSTVRTVSAACGPQPAVGKLLAIRLTLDKNGSAGVAALFPNGREEIIAWIRDYDPDYTATYWLRRPLLLPRGSRIRVESSGQCAIELRFARDRSGLD